MVQGLLAKSKVCVQSIEGSMSMFGAKFAKMFGEVSCLGGDCKIKSPGHMAFQNPAHNVGQMMVSCRGPSGKTTKSNSIHLCLEA